ncbi:MAG TPA: hypothetical protein VIL36_17550, partial [Acidimicrobiales bacterium]
DDNLLLWAGGGPIDSRPIDDAVIRAAADLAGGHGRLYVYFDGAGSGRPSDEGVLRVTPDGSIEQVGLARGVGLAAFGRDLTAVGLGEDGVLALAYGPGDVQVRGFDWLDLGTGRLDEIDQAPFEVGAIGVVGRDEVLLGSAERGEIARVTPEGVETVVEGDFGAVKAIAPLDDGTVAFVAGDDGLFVADLVDGTASRVDTGDVQPVAAGSTGNVDMSGLPRRDRWPMAPIAPAPGGRIVAVGEHEGHPRITLVDPGTGEVEVLADLEGVVPTVEERVAAAVVGDDLFFLAEGSLWKKPGVVG